MTDQENSEKLSDLSDSGTVENEQQQIKPIKRRIEIDQPIKRERTEKQKETILKAQKIRQERYHERVKMREEDKRIMDQKKEQEIRAKIEKEQKIEKPQSSPKKTKVKDETKQQIKKLNMEKLIAEKIQIALEDERERVYNEKEMRRLRKIEEEVLREKKANPHKNVKFRTFDGEYF